MVLFLSLLLTSGLAAQQTAAPGVPRRPQAQMEARVQLLLKRAPGTVSFFAKNLDTGRTYGIRPDDKVRTASTIKLPIMAATFAEVAAGRAKWDDLIPLDPELKVSGSGVLTELTDNVKLPLRDLVHLMIVVSDNSATNLVLSRITADAVNRFLDQLELPQTRSLRMVLGKAGPRGHSAAGRLPENQRFGLGVSTPRDMVTLLEKLDRGEIVSPEASREMIAILKRQQYKDAIGRTYPGEIIASKSGSLDALRSDVGIVYSPGGRIAIAITVDGIRKPDWSPDNPGLRFISDLAAILVQGLAR